MIYVFIFHWYFGIEVLKVLIIYSDIKYQKFDSLLALWKCFLDVENINQSQVKYNISDGQTIFVCYANQEAFLNLNCLFWTQYRYEVLVQYQY